MDAREREVSRDVVATDDEDALSNQKRLMQAISYFAVGVSSESGVGGRDVSNQLKFAGTRRNGILDPVGNSGFSVGTLQIDLSQHPKVAEELVAAYQTWSAAMKPEWSLTNVAVQSVTRDLSRKGHRIEMEGGRDIDHEMRNRLDTFLDADAGRRFVHDLDLRQIEVLWNSIGQKLASNPMYLALSTDDQVRVATMMLKLQNQSGSGHTPRILRSMERFELDSVGDVSAAIGRIDTGASPYLQSGRDHALKGAEVLVALRGMQAGSALADAFAAVALEPLVSTVELRRPEAIPDSAAQYATVKTLFLQSSEAPLFIRAVENGATHIYGRPQPEGKLAATAGLFSSGDNLVVWNRDGAGYSFIDGAWAPVARDDLKRVTLPDKTIDLRIARDGVDATLLHLDRNAPVLRPETPTGRQEAQSPTTPGLPEPLEEQARDAVRRLDASLGRTTDDMSLRMAGSLAALARQHDIARIDHVVLSHANPYLAAGEHVFVVQGRLDDPAQVRAQMRTDDALSGVELRTQPDAGDTRARMPAQMAPDPGQQVDPPRRGLV